MDSHYNYYHHHLSLSLCMVSSSYGNPNLSSLVFPKSPILALSTISQMAEPPPPPSLAVRAGASPSSAETGIPTYNSNYVVPLVDGPEPSSCITRTLPEILCDLNQKVPHKVLRRWNNGLGFIPWYHANRMLSFYAPGWCGEVRGVSHNANGCNVTVVYRVTIRGSDGEISREASGTANMKDEDPVQMAEALAFQRACACFGLGLYLYHEDYDIE